VLQLTRLEWHKNGELKWEHFGVGIGYVLVALLGYVFAHFRIKFGILIFALIEWVIFIVYMIFGTLVLIQIGSCTWLGDDCSSTFFEADLIVTILVLSLNGLILLMAGIFSLKMFHTINTLFAPSTTYQPVGAMDDIGSV